MWRPLLLNAHWMSWNLLLALVPAALAAVLFRPGIRTGALWAVGLGTLVAFLPNAPYVLTDVVHLPGDLRALDGEVGPTAAVMAQYALLCTLGFLAYGFTVLRLERWLARRGWSRTQLMAVDATIHVVCAMGVFLGRVWRFNSWTLVDEPGDVVGVVVSGLLDPKPRTVVAVIGATAVFAAGTMVLRAFAVAGRRAVI